MSTYARYVLECDCCSGELITSGQRVEEAREEAGDCGWLEHPGLDFCCERLQDLELSK